MSAIKDLLVRVVGDTSQLEDAFKGAGARVSSSMGGVGDSMSSLGTSVEYSASRAQVASDVYDGLGGKLVRLGQIGTGVKALFGVAQGALAVGQSMIAGNAQMETYETQLGSLLGGADKAKERLAELSEFGAKTPFEVGQLVEAEKVMVGFGLTTGKSMTLANKSASEMRTVIGDVAAGTGKDFAEIALTFGKFSAGATGEAISRLQELGVVTKEEMAEMGIAFDKGGALKSSLPEAFEVATAIAQKKFGGGMDNLSSTFSGQMSTLADTVGIVKRAFMAPVFEVFKAGLNAVLPMLGSFASGAESVSAAFLEGGIERAALELRDLTGIDLSGPAKALADFGARVQGGLSSAFSDLKAGFIDARDQGMGPFTAAIEAVGYALQMMGLESVGELLRSFVSGFRMARDDAMNPLSAAAAGLSDALASLGLEGVSKWFSVFGAASSQAIDVLRGGQDTISSWNPEVTSMGNTLLGFGMAAQGVFRDLMGMFGGAGKEVQSASESFRMVGETMAPATAQAGPLSGMIDKVKKGFQDAKPALQGLLDALKWFGQWIIDHKEMIAGFIAAQIAWAGAVKLAQKTVGAAIPNFITLDGVLKVLTLTQTLLNIVTLAKGLRGGADAAVAAAPAMKSLTVATQGTTVAQGALNAVMMMNPIGLIIIAVLALIGIAVALKVAWDNNFGGIQEKTAAVVAWFQTSILPPIQAAFAAVIAAVVGLVAGVVAKFAEAKAGIDAKLKEAQAVISAVWSVIQLVVATAVEVVRQKVMAAFDAVKGYIQAAQDFIRGIILRVWNMIPEDIRVRLEKIWAAIVAKFEAVKTYLSAVWAVIVSAAQVAWDNLTAAISGAVDGAVEFLRGAWSVIEQVIIEPVMRAVESAKQWFSDLATAVKLRVDMAVAAARIAFAGIIVAIVRPVMKAKDDAVAAFNKLKDDASAKLAGLVDKVKGIGGDIISGLINGLNSAKNRLFTWLADLTRAFLDQIMGFFKIGSPSKIMEEVGAFIMEGLRLGLHKHDRKMLEGMADVVSKVGAILGGLQDFATKLLKFVVPDASQVAAARKQFTAILLIVNEFVKDFAYLGSLLPVSNIDDASGSQRSLIDSVVRSKFGVGIEDLVTGGEASWVGMLTDIISKVTQSWGSIAENLTKIADAKFPTGEQFQKVQDSAVAMVVWAKTLTEIPLPVGLHDFADMAKTAADILVSVTKIDLSKAAEVTSEQLRIATVNIREVGKWASGLVSEWMGVAGDEKSRVGWLANMRQFADSVKAGSDILAASAVPDLSKVSAVTKDQLRVVSENFKTLGSWTAELVKEWLSVAGSPAVRESWLASMKQFAETVSAAVSIAKASEVGELKPLMEVDMNVLRQVLGWMRDEFVPAIQAIVERWQMASAEAKLLTERMGEFSNWLKAAVEIAKVSEVGELKAAISVNMDYLGEILVWMRDIFAPALQAIAVEWKTAAAEAKLVTERMGLFAGWISAAVDIASLAGVGELKTEVLVNMEYLRDILVWMRDSFAPMLQGIADEWKMGVDEAKAITERMTSFSAWIKAATEIAQLAGVGELKTDVLVNMTYLKDILKWMRDDFVPAIAEIVSHWTMADKEAEELTKRMTLFGGTVKAAREIADAVSGMFKVLAESKLNGDIGPKLAQIESGARLAFAMLGRLALTISDDAMKAKSIFATNAATAVKAIGEITGGITAILGLQDTKLFAADIGGKSKLGFMERVRSIRADFFAQKISDTIKRAVKAIMDALDGMALTPGDPRVTALNELATAFKNLADALVAFGGVKVPNLAGLSGALAGGTGGGGGAAPAFFSGPVTAIGPVQFSGTLVVPVSIDGTVITSIMKTGSWNVSRGRAGR